MKIPSQKGKYPFLRQHHYQYYMMFYSYEMNIFIVVFHCLQNSLVCSKSNISSTCQDPQHISLSYDDGSIFSSDNVDNKVNDKGD